MAIVTWNLGETWYSLQLAQSINVKHNFESTKTKIMQLQDAFLFKDIHWFNIHKKSWTVSIKQIYFFTRTYSMPSNAEDLSICGRTFPDHTVDLVYEAGCCGFSAARYFKLGWNVLVVNPSDVRREIKSAIKNRCFRF
jgi:hypothetical protein